MNKDFIIFSKMFNLKSVSMFLIKSSILLFLIIIISNICMSIFQNDFITGRNQNFEKVYIYY